MKKKVGFTYKIMVQIWLIFLPPPDGSDSTRAMNPKSIGHRKIKLDPMAKL